MNRLPSIYDKIKISNVKFLKSTYTISFKLFDVVTSFALNIDSAKLFGLILATEYYLCLKNILNI